MNKNDILTYFRHVVNQVIQKDEYLSADHKKKAGLTNKALRHAMNIKVKEQQSLGDPVVKLENILLINYSCDVVMLETRNFAWNYDYMSFSRRVGEIWEPFCKIPFEYPINSVHIEDSPSFEKVIHDAKKRIDILINTFVNDPEGRESLNEEIENMIEVILSQNTQLPLDLHFKYGEHHYVVDFKSGFKSNEKGNTNRLLEVAYIYKHYLSDYQPLLWVRQKTNNNDYFERLRTSENWKAYTGNETYEEIMKYSGYDLLNWMQINVNWENDLDTSFVTYLKENDLWKYLTWFEGGES